MTKNGCTSYCHCKQLHCSPGAAVVGGGSLKLFTTDSVTNKSTVAHGLERCHGPAVEAAATTGPRVCPSRRRREATGSLCAAAPLVELTGGDFGGKNVTRRDGTESEWEQLWAPFSLVASS